MEKRIYDAYVFLLNKTLKLATGCTEPIAIAYAGAILRRLLGCIPEHCEVYCSGNIIKNVMGVTVPRSGGSKGIAIAALLGIVGGDADRVLDVLHSVRDDDIVLAKKLQSEGRCSCKLVEGVENLYIRIEGKAGDESALVEIKDSHSKVTRLIKNTDLLYDSAEPEAEDGTAAALALLNMQDIWSFADEVELKDIREVLLTQLNCNTAIAEAGIRMPWGAEVGRTILAGPCGSHLTQRASAYAAAGSDARMNGCPMPVVINSGSGNQGLAVTLPLAVYAKEYGIDEDRLLRALALANLACMHQKRQIGPLSAYCGAVCAATAGAAGIVYMLGGSFKQACDTITNSINTIGGMICDGAKSSCASKIAASVGTALLSMQMSMKGRVFQPGEGLVKDDIEKNIASVGRMGREGMKSTDLEILRIMLEQ